ncbi:hypothetical protein SUGI_0971070 [Cryptomeria japonica]|nr:hypothetical protein SUGI_0971010 [Cryptomeria japonica]GLJ46105.1 hypothetical protein SUGI_0971070 [Cryptomeria japonica]
MDQKKIVRCSIALMLLLMLISAGIANGDRSEMEGKNAEYPVRAAKYAWWPRRVIYKTPPPQGNRAKAYDAPRSPASPGAPRPSTNA